MLGEEISQRALYLVWIRQEIMNRDVGQPHSNQARSLRSLRRERTAKCMMHALSLLSPSYLLFGLKK